MARSPAEGGAPSRLARLRLRLPLPAPLLAAAWASAFSASLGSGVPWYQGVDSIKVLTPETACSELVRSIHEEMQFAQFTDKRVALLLRAGHYAGLAIPVGYYTSVVGLSADERDVVVESFYTLDGLVGGATQNFWRSVEGVTAMNPSVTWATSQGCPVRRTTVKGDLWLSMEGAPHWSSGGFIGDVTVEGNTHVGTQQQFFFRNSELKGGVDFNSGNLNFVFVGAEGGPAETNTTGSPRPSVVNATPQIAEKPFLVEEEGQWYIVVPATQRNARGRIEGSARIAMEDVFIARVGDTAASINSGIASKLALLLTPAIYGLDDPIHIVKDSFLVLGIGFATLVPTHGRSALLVSAADVRVAGFIVEAGSPRNGPATDAMINWTGNGGVISDVFTRVGAFKYAAGFHESCSLTRADVHINVDGDGVVLDNVWNWHADHDDCGNLSDNCYSRAGLIVNGQGVIAYGLAVEHMMGDMLEWHGEYGQVYFFQSEFPYNDPEFGTKGFVGYKVDYRVKEHTALGIGLYIVGPLEVRNAMEVPPSANVVNAVAWCITGATSQFHSIVCTGRGSDDCFGDGDALCLYNKCFFGELPTKSAGGNTTTSAKNSSLGPHVLVGKWQQAETSQDAASPRGRAGAGLSELPFTVGGSCLLLLVLLVPTGVLASCRQRRRGYEYTEVDACSPEEWGQLVGPEGDGEDRPERGGALRGMLWRGLALRPLAPVSWGRSALAGQFRITP